MHIIAQNLQCLTNVAAVARDSHYLIGQTARLIDRPERCVVNSSNSCSQPCCSPAPRQPKSLIVLLLLNSMAWAGHAIPAQQYKIHERMQHQPFLHCAVLQELHLVQALYCLQLTTKFILNLTCVWIQG